MSDMEIFICLLAGYLVGSINPSYLISRAKGFDIREKGSGNAGGSNALIMMGKTIGAICILFDIFKAYAIIKLTMYLFPDSRYAFAITACSSILGHMFPFYMRFRGGKGLACMAGALLAYSPVIFLIALLVEAVLAFSLDYICVIPISASVVLPILYGFFENDYFGALFMAITGIAVILKHRENIRRVKNGTELHLSFLWNKEKEIARVQEAIDNGNKI